MVDRKQCPVVKEFSKMMKRLRKESEMSQYMLAEESHISLRQIIRYETKQSFPFFCAKVRIIQATEHEPINEIGNLISICKNCTKIDICLTSSLNTN
jgi:transcriptional regulator with XRE-family HTH domain